MNSVLSLQMLGTDLAVESSCSSSHVSCPSNVSCNSSQSGGAAPKDSFGTVGTSW
jgi:hypothetical protein